MTRSDPMVPWEPSVSRREFLLAGMASSLITNAREEGGARSSDGSESISDLNLATLSWKRDLEVPLDYAAGIVEDPGSAIVATNPLLVDFSRVFALDVRTGEQRWTRELADLPRLWPHNGALYHQGTRELVRLDPSSGEERWRLNTPVDPPFYARSSHAAFSANAEAGSFVNLAEGTVAWRPDTHLENAVGIGEGTAVFHGGGEIAAFGTIEGEDRWRLEGFPQDRFSNWGRSDWPFGFHVSSEPPRTTMIDLREGEIRWQRELTLVPRYFETDTAGNVVLATAGGDLLRLALDTGEVLWSRSLTDGPLYVYEVTAGLAVPVAEDRIWAVSLSDGSVSWGETISSAFPVVSEHGGSLYASGEDLAAYEADGTQTWTDDLPAKQPTVPAIGTDYLVATSGTSVFGFNLTEVRENPSPTETTATEETSPPAETTSTPETAEVTDTARLLTPTEGPSQGTTVDSTATETPGFGLIAALLGLGGFAEYLRRRAKDDDQK